MLAETSVRKGNLAGIDLWLEDVGTGRLRIETNVVSREVDLSQLDDATGRFRCRRTVSQAKRLYCDWSRRLTFEHQVTFQGNADCRFTCE